MNDGVASMIDELLADSPGNALRKSREAQSMTVREVAEQLRLLPRQVEALESDDYANLNGDIFCKGYLKSYGKLLGLNTDLLIEAYLQVRPTVSTKTNYAPKNYGPVQIQTLGKGHSLQYWFLAATLLVIAILWLVLGGDSSAEKNVVVESTEVIVDQQLATDAETAAIMAGSAIDQESADDMIAAPTATDTLVAEAVSPVLSQSTTNGQPRLTSAGAESVESEAKSLLNFSFTNDCWVEVKDSNDTVIFANLKRARDTLELSGAAPFKVLLGYAPGVSLDFNGDPVTITVNEENNSARFTVGQL
ncbi:RodZ domain-containing protein [Oceanicoccus sp. KOV_DT_Chl]|uniref:RodZ domain-containing protein n=1 Tax=Oceanicoccus sp. KOV_DT_Chl TaxID=1904639 RepID=UPI000C7D1685|nr:RodZ domain-containing protein [Oceanicoccus sp. KOV_DT_Chl]